MSGHDPSSWRELAEQKEKEWREASQKRVESLEHALHEKEKTLTAEKSRLNKLKEDFKYNLKLLDERDQELQTYDASFTELRAQLNAKNGEISELRIRLDDMKKAAERESQAMTELQSHYQHRLRERQTEVDSFKISKDADLEKERKEFETFRRNLQLRLKEVEDELDTQKRELSSSFEEALKRREHEFRVKADEMSAKVLEYELKAKLLEKEMEMMRSVRDQQTEKSEESDTQLRLLEKALREREWQVKDVTAMKDARISDLQNNLQQTEKAMVKLQEDFQRKFAEMDRLTREKESNLGKVKEACVEREQKLQETVRDLQSHIESQQIEIRRLEWQNQDLVKDKELKIGKLQEELDSQRSGWEQHVGEMSQQQVARDLELDTLREGEGRLRADILQKQRDIDRYKKDLSLAADREASLERSKTQLELDWQRRFEEVERHQYEKSEDYIKKLTHARDQAVAELKEKTRDLEQKDMLIKAVQRDRNIAMATLKQHGIPLNKNINLDTSLFEEESAREVRDLQEQNENLREVIRQMREQMEQLGHEVPPTTFTSAPPSSDYMESLEKEVSQLKQKVRKLQDDLDVKRSAGVNSQDSEVIMKEVKDTRVRNHIQMLNNMLGSVRSEKVELTAQIRKQQARIQYMDSQVSQLEKQPRQKQVLVDQLQYEVNASKRRHEAEVSGLRARVSDLEQQVLEGRKEADEFHRSALEQNAEVTSLSNELSALKMEMSESRPAVNFGAQELVIQQLQDEILRLKQRSGGQTGHTDFDVSVDDQGESTLVQQLRAKLKQAVKHISQLAKEKQQLIEMGNRLRAQLMKTGSSGQDGYVRREITSPPRESRVSGGVQSKPGYTQQYQNKLAELEALQYQLTKQELQYAQNYSKPVHQSTDKSLDDVPTRQKSPPYPVDQLNRTQSSLGDTQQTHDRKLLLSMSSGGGESLQEIWRMLDERQSPTIFTPKTPRRHTDITQSQSPRQRHGSPSRTDSGLRVSGTKTGLSNRPSPERKTASVKPREPKRSGPKLRNYNIRDDSAVR